MAEKTQDKNGSKKLIIILLIIIALLIIGGIVTVTLLLTGQDDDGGLPDDGGGFEIGYDNAAVVLDEDSLRERMEEAMKNAEEGQIAAKYQRTATSKDGVNFECYIGNSAANLYDMYFNIFKDDTLTEQVLLTGLFKPGEGMASFESEIKLDPGTYQAVLVLTQVEDDHSTMHAQTMVAIDLIVQEQ